MAHTQPDEPINTLTKREFFAAMAMQGMLANQAVFMGDDPVLLARKSEDCADKLIEQLNLKK